MMITDFSRNSDGKIKPPRMRPIIIINGIAKRFTEIVIEGSDSLSLSVVKSKGRHDFKVPTTKFYGRNSFEEIDIETSSPVLFSRRDSGRDIYKFTVK